MPQPSDYEKITISPINAGYIQPIRWTSNTVAQLKAIPYRNYKFEKWTYNGITYWTGQTYTFSLIIKGKGYTGVFSKWRTSIILKVQYLDDDIQGCYISLNNSSQHTSLAGDTIDYLAPYGYFYSLQAISSEDCYEFVEWRISIEAPTYSSETTNLSRTITATIEDEDITYTAVFRRKTFPVTTRVSPEKARLAGCTASFNPPASTP